MLSLPVANRTQTRIVFEDAVLYLDAQGAEVNSKVHRLIQDIEEGAAAVTIDEEVRCRRHLLDRNPRRSPVLG